jgi:hypothetical protein
MVVEINWNNFRAKFNNQEQSAFERLCYLLFCKEHGKDTGIFRFKNHAGVETNPIESNGEIIGWQAKFYGTPLSQHTAEFNQSIDTSKARHPSITKLVFYTNQDFGQSKTKTDPQYKTDIEAHARAKAIDIEWRTASYFESPFVSEYCSSISEHFFSLKKGILDSVGELVLHTEALLKPIHSDILYTNNKIKLDRSGIVGHIKQAANNSLPIILSGAAGAGKTAVVKDFYETVINSSAFFVIKTTEFKSISHINQLFAGYGQLTAADFIAEHKDITNKYIVFDSAEKLSEIEDQDVFRSFLSSLLESSWRVIFTVRYSYLDDLRFQLSEIYGTTFTSLTIPTLTREELENTAAKYGFALPHNERLKRLLETPLYLNEYLRSYASIGTNTSYADFREMIWKKQIQNSFHQLHNLHLRREQCFLSIARKRATEGSFFVKTPDCDQEALHKLAADEIITYDANTGGYFIAHDVYEEWGLDKLIERAFLAANNHVDFYGEIGHSLPIRRAFRNWLSDKLVIDPGSVQELTEFTINSADIDAHWKDEVLVALLLSDYSTIFYERFEDQLLADPEKRDVSMGTAPGAAAEEEDAHMLLHRILFLLRIACKTADEKLLRSLGLAQSSMLSFQTVLTIPKGSGWNSTIAFINKHKTKLRFTYMAAILAILDDWNRGYKEGETTKNAAQIALFYYAELTKEKAFYFSSRDDTKDKLIKTILNGSGEIKTELTTIINESISSKESGHRNRYYELVKVILSSILDSSEIAKHLPKEVLKLAYHFWLQTPRSRYSSQDFSIEIEPLFGLSDAHFEYYPASAFQTPIFQLLQTDPKATADFILSFTNRSIEYFAKTEFARHEVGEIDVVVDDAGTTVKQYICHRIWNIYRGTQVAPSVLESAHMALERWFLTNAKSATPETLQSWCLYLMKNSRSASITAIVASVVMAEPSKLFNVAAVLFRTKDLFFFDNSRRQLDMGAKSMYSISHDRLGIFKNERLKTCDDKHRSNTLENLALQYQLFVTEEEGGEEVAKQRQEVLWKIFDDYYGRLPQKDQENEGDKLWRLSLARMDRRAMNITAEAKDDQVLVSFTPEIDPELKEYSESSLAKTSESMKYLSLQVWSRHGFEGNEGRKKYQQYDNDPATVLAETKQVIEGLKNDREPDKKFTLFYHSIPPYACAVLIRDYFGKLDDQGRDFCKNILIGYASLPLREDYRYQIGDGVEAAIGALPALMKSFPQDVDGIKKILLLTLFDSYPIGMNQRLSDYAVGAIQNSLWKESSADANSIFLGFLALKPKYDELWETMREESYRQDVYEISKMRPLEVLLAENETLISKIVENQISYADISDVRNIDPDILVTAFKLLLRDTADSMHKQFFSDIFPVFSKRLFLDDHRRDRDDSFDYNTRHSFLEKLAYVLLSCNPDDLEMYVRPFVEDFKDSRDAADLFSELVTAEDKLVEYDRFWSIWKLFYPPILSLAKRHKRWRHDSSEIIHNYLLAWSYWREEAREWHSLKDRERQFFKQAAAEMGGNPSVFYSIVKLLNDIGSGFRDEGVLWVSDMVKNNPGLAAQELEMNTVHYLENLVRGYTLINRSKIRATPRLRSQVLVILDFLLLKGSVTGYLLREDIL